jgi:hypothetical protein
MENQTIITQNSTPEEASAFEKIWKGKLFKTGLVLLIIGLILYYVYQQGRQTIKDNAKKIPLLKIENDGSIDSSFKDDSVETVKEIFRVTDGTDWWNVGIGGIKSKHFEAKNQLYGKLLKMTRPQLFYVYNLYNLTHYPTTEETMTQAITGDQSSFLQNSPDNETKIVSKMKTLKMP